MCIRMLVFRDGACELLFVDIWALRCYYDYYNNYVQPALPGLAWRIVVIYACKGSCNENDLIKKSCKNPLK